MQECVDGSFDGGSTSNPKYDNDNVYLREMQNLWKKYGTHSMPALVINDITFRGQLSPFNAFEAICAGYPAKNMPHDCRKWLHMEGIQLDEDTDGVDFTTLMIIMIVLVIINIILIYVYRRWV